MSEKKSEFYMPPPKLGKWEGFKIFLWNSETNQFLGRTGASWGKILLFYLLFYTGLVGFFAAMLTVFYQTLDMHRPKFELDSSLIGTNPGLGFRPMPPEENVESTLIWYRLQNDNYKHWTTELDKFLEGYKQTGTGDNRIACDFETNKDENKVCDVDISTWTPCTGDKYNYDKAGPCIFLKINKIFNWDPMYYNDTQGLPNDMPADLVSHIEETKRSNPKTLNTVWVSCTGENPADIENTGPIQYIPGRGFPGYYFPFKNQDGYISPLVAVYFEKPARGVLINIECKAWAKNIHHDRAERRGSVHFELMIDD